MPGLLPAYAAHPWERLHIGVLIFHGCCLSPTHHLIDDCVIRVSSKAARESLPKDGNSSSGNPSTQSSAENSLPRHGFTPANPPQDAPALCHGEWRWQGETSKLQAALYSHLESAPDLSLACGILNSSVEKQHYLVEGVCKVLLGRAMGFIQLLETPL